MAEKLLGYLGHFAKPAVLAAGHNTVLTAAARKRIPSKNFAVPSKAPGSGSYPIPDASHARNALARSSGKPVAAKVRAKVHAKFPGIA